MVAQFVWIFFPNEFKLQTNYEALPLFQKQAQSPHKLLRIGNLKKMAPPLQNLNNFTVFTIVSVHHCPACYLRSQTSSFKD